MKQLIRSAALKMFLEDGYAKTSIRNIAEAIEYSPGTIYLYYKDKDELLYEVQGHAYGKLLEAFRANAKSKDPLIKLKQICKTYISFGLENPELYDLMFIIRSPMNVDEKLHKANGGETLAYLVDCLEECFAANLIRLKDVQTATLQIWSMAHGLLALNLRCRLRIMIPEDNKVAEILDQAIENFIGTITR